MEMLWEPSQELTEQEEQIASTMKRTRKLLPFLRRHRHEILDRKFHEELCGLYRSKRGGEAGGASCAARDGAAGAGLPRRGERLRR